MPFDFKKEYKEFYMPQGKPGLVNVPEMHYLAVRGAGDPNEQGGAYQQAVGVLYALAYTLKMSARAGHAIEGFFDYVVPPLEGFWYQQDVHGVDYSRKDAFHWLSVIRLPDFVTREDFDWAVREAGEKKKTDCAMAEYLSLTEGLCVQILHIGAFDDEPASVRQMHDFARAQGFAPDITDARLHHEIYLSDPRKTPPEKRKTVIRHPVKPLAGA